MISNVKGRNLTSFLTSEETMSGQGLGTSKSLRLAVHWTTYKTNLAMYELRATVSKDLTVMQTKTISRKEKFIKSNSLVSSQLGTPLSK